MMIKTILKIVRFIFIGVLVILLLLNIVDVVQRVVFKDRMPLVGGFGKAVIVSGSMEPGITRGDIVIIHKQDDYAVGDIIMFQANSYITHRVIEKTPGGYITQGDANNVPDQEIEGSNVVGRVVKIIPRVGNIIFFLQNPLYMFIFILLIFVGFELPRLCR